MGVNAMSKKFQACGLVELFYYIACFFRDDTKLPNGMPYPVLKEDKLSEASKGANEDLAEKFHTAKKTVRRYDRNR